MAGMEDVLEVRGYPEPLRKVDADGTTVMIWAYPDTVHRDMWFVAFVLVRRPPARAVDLPVNPT
jgi:hypothetical protein